MLGFDVSSKKEQQYVLFDIGSASVRVGVAVYSEDSIKLVWSKSFEYGYQANDDYNRYVRTMYATLLEAGMRLTSEGFREAKALYPTFSVKEAEVFCLLTPPWVRSFVQTQTETKEKPFAVSINLLKELQDRGFSKILQDKEILSWQELMGTPKLLEVYPDAVFVEGYQVNQFEHAVVHTFSVQSYFSVVSESVQEHIREVIERVLPNHEIHFSSSPRIFSTAGFEKPYLKTRSLCIEIGGEITTVAIVTHGLLSSVTAFPLGTNHVLKSIAPLALSAKEARSTLEILHKKNRSDLQIASLPENVRDALSVWKDAVVKSALILSHGVELPRDTRILVGAPWYPLYKVALEELSKKLPNTDKIINLDVQRIGTEAENSTGENADALRLILFARALHHCTSKNTMCYTKENI